MSKFELPSSSASRPSTPSSENRSPGHAMTDPDDDDDYDLPYPEPLPRSAFAVPASSFSAAAYLSTLSHRHQTLADLRADLRARSQLIGKELLDLVNGNYADFLSLGQALQGGEERVEEVRVGLLGMRKAVGEVRERVAEREDEVRGLVEERERVRRERGVARGLLEVERRVGELEAALLVGQGHGAAAAAGAVAGKAKGGGTEDGASEESSDEDEDDEDSDEDEDGLGASSVSLARLRRLVRQYLGVRQLARHIGSEHPFLVAQEPRLTKLRNTLLLDLGAALKQAKAAGAPGKNRVLKIMSIYAEMDEGMEAIKVLKEGS